MSEDEAIEVVVQSLISTAGFDGIEDCAPDGLSEATWARVVARLNERVAIPRTQDVDEAYDVLVVLGE